MIGCKMLVGYEHRKYTLVCGDFFKSPQLFYHLMIINFWVTRIVIRNSIGLVPDLNQVWTDFNHRGVVLCRMHIIGRW
jgi:hypothetical protein